MGTKPAGEHGTKHNEKYPLSRDNSPNHQRIRLRTRQSAKNYSELHTAPASVCYPALLSGAEAAPPLSPHAAIATPSALPSLVLTAPVEMLLPVPAADGAAAVLVAPVAGGAAGSAFAIKRDP